MAVALRRAPSLWLALCCFVLYCGASLFRHFSMLSTGYDLGIFEQAVRAYSEFRLPVTDLKGPGFELLGDHFHPILVLLAPLYWIFPHPSTLLIAQAALFALSVLPITRLARERLGAGLGLAIGVAYGLSWGLLQAVWFDFHEVAFAVPLTAFVATSLARRQWSHAALWALPLLLVKEDQWLTVALVGAYIAVRGARRLGIALAASSVAAGLLTIFVVIPSFSPEGAYPYFLYATGGDTNVVERLMLPGVKWITVLWLLIPTLFIALRSPIILLCLPNLAWRFWGTNSHYWIPDYHYSATLMPILFVAMVDGLSTRDPISTADKTPVLRLQAAMRSPKVGAAAIAIALVTTVLVARGHRDAFEAVRSPSEIAAARNTLAVIPDGASVSADNRIAVQLTSRCTVYLFPMQALDTSSPAEWVAVANSGPGIWMVSLNGDSSQRDFDAAVAALESRGYAAVAKGGGITVYRLTR